jgi:hypothetical protein
MFYGGFIPSNYGSTATSATTSAVGGATTGGLAVIGVAAAAGSAVPVLGTIIGAAAGAIIYGLMAGIQARRVSREQALAAGKQIGLGEKDSKGLYDFVLKALTWDKAKLRKEIKRYQKLHKLENDDKWDVFQPRTWFRGEKRVGHKIEILACAYRAKYGQPKETEAAAGKSGKVVNKKAAAAIAAAKAGPGMTTRVGGRTSSGFAPSGASIQTTSTSTFPWKPAIAVGGVVAVGAVVYFFTRKPKGGARKAAEV